MAHTITHVSSWDEFKRYVSTEPVVCLFTAPWCVPCRIIHPIFEKMASIYSGYARFLEVNIDKNQDISANLSIRSIPHIRFYTGYGLDAKDDRLAITGGAPAALEANVHKFATILTSFQTSEQQNADDSFEELTSGEDVITELSCDVVSTEEDAEDSVQTEEDSVQTEEDSVQTEEDSVQSEEDRTE